MGKAPKKGDLVSSNPTDRAKGGVKRSVHVEGNGGPPGIVLAGASRPDVQLLAAVLDAGVAEPPRPTARRQQHRRLNQGYTSGDGWAVVVERGDDPHSKMNRVPDHRAPGEGGWPARRWVVECPLSWLAGCRGILIRWKHQADNYLAGLQFACDLR